MGDAIVSLVLERGFENLTVTALRERANVGRATFYRHYKTLDELLIDTLRNTMRELAERLRQEESMYAETVALFRFVQENQDRFRVIIALPDVHPIRDMLKEAAVKVVIERWEARSTSPVPMNVSVNHLVESSYVFLRWHLNNINDHTPEQAADFYFDLIIRGAESRALSLRTDRHLHSPGNHED